MPLLLEIEITDPVSHPPLEENIPDGVTIKQHSSLLFAEGGPAQEIISYVIELSPIVRDIAVGLVSAWLYDKIKHSGGKKVTINRKQCDLTEGSIRRIVEETIKIED